MTAPDPEGLEWIVIVRQDNMVVKDSIGQCWFTCQKMPMATALQSSLETRTTARNGPPVMAIQAKSRLEQLLPIAESPSHY